MLRDYYIFTSDAACKKAYDLMTASSVTGAISNVFGGDKKANSKSDSKDSGGMETVIGVVIGVAVLGAVGYGEYRMFGKAEAAKGTAQVLIIILLPVRSQCNDPVRRCLIRMDSSQCNGPVRQCLIRMVRSQCNDPEHRCLIRMDSSQSNGPVQQRVMLLVNDQPNDLAQQSVVLQKM